MDGITQHIEQIHDLCKQNRVKELYAFGSVLNHSFNKNSDIDLLVDFKDASPSEYTKNYFNLKFALESVLSSKIDLLETRSLKNPYFIQEINQKKQLLYVA